MVPDESLLTDIKADPDTDPETFYDTYASADAEPDPDDTTHLAFSTSTPRHPLALVSSSCSQTPTNAYPVPDDNTMPKYATYPQPARSATPSAPLRTSTEHHVNSTHLEATCTLWATHNFPDILVI